MAVKIQLRRDLAANWGSSTVLASGEVGYETDTGNIKIGDGTTQWSALAYYQLPNVSVNPATTADLNNAAYRVMGRYRLNSVTGGSTFTNAPSDLDTADADSYCAMIVTSHAYTALSTLIQQTLTQFSGNGTTLKQWVRMYDGTNWTAWTSTAHLSDNEVTFAKMQDIAGLSVIGKTGSGSGDPAAITAATSGHVLRYDGTNVAFGTLTSGAFAATTDIPLTALADQAAVSVVANGSASSAAPTAITAGTDGHVLVRSSGTLGFGQIASASIPANTIPYDRLSNSTRTTLLGATSAGAISELTMLQIRNLCGFQLIPLPWLSQNFVNILTPGSGTMEWLGWVLRTEYNNNPGDGFVMRPIRGGTNITGGQTNFPVDIEGGAGTTNPDGFYRQGVSIWLRVV